MKKWPSCGKQIYCHEPRDPKKKKKYSDYILMHWLLSELVLLARCGEELRKFIYFQCLSFKFVVKQNRGNLHAHLIDLSNKTRC